MDEWSGLRAAAVIVMWVTVAGGLTMLLIWALRGGNRAIGPEDEIMAQSGVPLNRRRRGVTSFSSAQIGMHGLLGVMTAALVTYAMVSTSDRQRGYVAVLVALFVTAIPGTLMFRKWRSGQRPIVPGTSAADFEDRVEDRLPAPIVYGHGLAAVATLALVVVLLFVD